MPQTPVADAPGSGNSAIRKVAFAVAAHPDDIEFVMSGTMMHLKAAGYELHYMNVANGCCGTTEYSRRDRGFVGTKVKRRPNFCATFHESLTNDLEIFYDKETLQKLASVMREVRPGIVLTHSPADYMEDHVNTCRLVVTALLRGGCQTFQSTRRCADARFGGYLPRPALRQSRWTPKARGAGLVRRRIGLAGAKGRDARAASKPKKVAR